MSPTSRIVVYASATSIRTRTYPVPDGVEPSRVHYWHGEAFHLVAEITATPSAIPFATPSLHAPEVRQ